MKIRLSYKELSLILGILVALIIAFTFWLSPQKEETGDRSSHPIPKLLVPAAKTFTEKTIEVFQFPSR